LKDPIPADFFEVNHKKPIFAKTIGDNEVFILVPSQDLVLKFTATVKQCEAWFDKDDKIALNKVGKPVIHLQPSLVGKDMTVKQYEEYVEKKKLER
jgi:hypothetical protein